MNIKEIKRLLSRYWLCETSLEEEKLLHDFFINEDVPAELIEYKSLFVYKQEKRSAMLSKDFDQRLEQAISRKTKQNRFAIKPLVRIVSQVAAAVILVGGIAVSLLFVSKHNNNTVVAGSALPPNMEVVKSALEKVSRTLQMSKELPTNSFQEVDNFDLNWSEIDSISSVLPYAIEE